MEKAVKAKFTLEGRKGQWVLWNSSKTDKWKERKETLKLLLAYNWKKVRIRLLVICTVVRRAWAHFYFSWFPTEKEPLKSCSTIWLLLPLTLMLYIPIILNPPFWASHSLTFSSSIPFSSPPPLAPFLLPQPPNFLRRTCQFPLARGIHVCLS